ncbi:MAG: restriction endonuclease subunit S, partial [Candidatus Electrothrix sp. AR3]|nr:restriction endonuclease subunit S [Candidatus Electrothrix sp. AR3]
MSGIGGWSLKGAELITEQLALWTGAETAKTTGGRGRKAQGELSLYGIKKLRELILELAVRGKLVAQDPADEPASLLLERIASEKARLIKAGKIKKQKALPPITEEEKPFALPAGWSFIRLLNVSILITKGSSPKWQGIAYTEDPDDILFVTSENVASYALKLDNKKYVEKKFNDVSPRSTLKKGDFLMNIVGASIGRTAIYDIDNLANINQAVCLIRINLNFLNSQHLLYFFNSETCRSYMFDKQVDNARANLSMGNIAKFVIPIPPLAEQQRIVAKIDELMTLCDQLEQQQIQSNTTQQTLLSTLLNTLTNSVDHADFTTSWQRLAEHFDILFTTEQSI